MNHIYRRIWSAAKQCWVVGSELSALRGKPHGDGARLSGNCAALAACFFFLPLAQAMEPAHCEPEQTECSSEVAATNIVRMNSLFKATDDLPRAGLLAVGETIWGDGIKRNGDHNTAFGYRVEVTGGYNTAVGSNARAHGLGSTALGNNSWASGVNSVAVGSGAQVTTNGGVGAIAVGADARAGTSGFTGAVSIGNQAVARYDGVALGYRANALARNSVALGNSSTAYQDNVVSVGNSSNQRRIVNVGRGSTSYGSTDAVTGGQLYETNQTVSAIGSVAGAASSNASAALRDAKAAQLTADNALLRADVLTGLINHATPSSSVRVGGSNSGTVLDVRNSVSANRTITGVADARLNTTSTDAVSGKQLNATNTKLADAQRVADAATARLNASAPAIGLAAEAEGSGSTASVAMGRSAKAYNTNSIAVGADARASVDANGDKSAATGAVALGAATRSGNGAVAAGLRASAVGDRAVAVGNDATAAATHATALGYKADASGNQAIAIGREAAASGLYSTALGNLAKAGAESAIALGDRALASHTGSVALGNGSQTNGINQVSVGSSSIKRKIVNLADGAVSSSSTEAVTGKQLNETNGRVTTAQNAANGAQATANAAQVDATKALAEATVLGGLVGQVSATGIVRVGEKNSGTVVDVRNSANANRKLTGVADGVVSASSYEAVNGRQLNATNEKVEAVEGMATSAAADATLAKADAAKALAETAVLGGLVAQVSASGDVRLGEKNSGTTLNVRNSANANRKISGVADGLLSASSAEAVSGKQLYSTNSRVSDLEDVAQFVSIGSAPFSERAEAGLAGVAVGNSAKTGLEGGTAVGTFAEAMGKNSTAIGRGATVSVDSENGFAMGVGARVGGDAGGARGGVAIGAGASVEGGADGSLALGMGSQADEIGVASFGSVGIQRRLVNIARGTADHNATTVSQLKDSLAILGGNAGMDAHGNIIAPTYAVQGGTQSNVEDALMALDGAVVSTTSRVNQVESQLRSVFQETPSVRADGTHQLTLAGANGMVISNVANGLIAAGSRDAVNGGQLHSMQQQINGRMDGLEQRIDDQPQARAMAAASTPSPSTEDIAPAPETSGSPQIASTGEGDKPTPQPKPKQDNTPKPQVDTADLEKMLARANEYTDGAISTFERRLDKMDKRFNRMAAMSSAQSAMAMNTAGLATYNRLGAGVGYSEGESAMAVGYQRVLNEKGSATFSLNGAFTNSGERSMGVGVGIGW
ncbi:ESPR-type extended signal peptide-containing protein [Stenotrophomonas muris]|uniref:ESPR-type extended signal peptide-containing protein n=1 Tax=Stenotrophomonas muris TaxID=2963283 RepID=UPI00383A3193